MSGGTGRSVLLGPVVDAKEGSGHLAGVLDRGRSTSTSVPIPAKDREETRTPDLVASTAATAASPFPGSAISSSTSTPAVAKPTILKRVAPTVVPGAASSASATSPFGDDEEWSRDPKAVVVSNSELWEQA